MAEEKYSGVERRDWKQRSEGARIVLENRAKALQEAKEKSGAPPEAEAAVQEPDQSASEEKVVFTDEERTGVNVGSAFPIEGMLKAFTSDMKEPANSAMAEAFRRPKELKEKKKNGGNGNGKRIEAKADEREAKAEGADASVKWLAAKTALEAFFRDSSNRALTEAGRAKQHQLAMRLFEAESAFEKTIAYEPDPLESDLSATPEAVKERMRTLWEAYEKAGGDSPDDFKRKRTLFNQYTALDGLYEKLTKDADSDPAVWRSNRTPRVPGAAPAGVVEPVPQKTQEVEVKEQVGEGMPSPTSAREIARRHFRTESAVSRENYDADGYAAAKPTEGVRSMGPKTRDEPRLGERVKMSQGNAAANTAPVIEAPGFVNVGTDPEKMKAAQVQQAARAQEPAPVRAPRERPPHPVDSEPLIQVETRKDQSAAVEPAASHRIEQTPVSEPDGRKEPVLGAEPIVEEKLDGGQQSPRAEGTWGEKMARLKTYVNALTEKMALSAKEGVKALTERGAKLAGYLAGRAKALDARIAQGSERQFGKLGDWYNKTPLWEKIVLGGSLAVGYGFTLPLSGWFAGAYAAPLIATRIAALAGSYRHNQKLLESINKKEAKGRLANTALYKWLASGTSEKERANAAMAKALLTSFGMAGGMSYAAHELAEHHVAEKIGQWLFDRGTTIHHSGLHAVQSPVTTAGAHQPHELFPQSAPAPAQVPVPTAEGVHTVPSSGAANVPSVAAETAASAPHVEVAAPAAPEIPSVYATASTGHGYEYMLKQMWHQLQDQHLDAAKYPEGSDIRTLLGATDKNIDGIVHQIASDPKHGFFNVDTHENVLIGKGDMLAFNTDGQVMHITPDGVANVHAPEGAAVTPPYHPEAPVAAQEIPAAQHLETVDLTAAQEEAAKHIEPMPVHDTPALDAAVNNPPAVEKQLTWHSGADGEGTLVDSAGHPVQSDVTEALPGANAFGIVVPENAPHLYADAAGQNLLAYGGSAAEQSKLIGEYLIRNPDKVVFGADEAGHRVAWHFLNGKVVAGPPMKNSGLLGLFSQWMKPPAPGDLAKVVR